MSIQPLGVISPDTVSAALFYLFAGMSAAGALGVLMTRNIVRTAICLLVALLGVGGLYLSLQSEFLAAVQLVVYAGGILVVIVFSVMLTNNSTFALYKVRRIEVIVVAGMVLMLFAALVSAILHSGLGQRVADQADSYPILHLGEALLGDYLVPFELISVLLLAVMIGAAYLAKARKRDGEAQ